MQQLHLHFASCRCCSSGHTCPLCNTGNQLQTAVTVTTRASGPDGPDRSQTMAVQPMPGTRSCTNSYGPWISIPSAATPSLCHTGGCRKVYPPPVSGVLLFMSNVSGRQAAYKRVSRVFFTADPCLWRGTCASVSINSAIARNGASWPTS
jgi:hypothetical protein